nr:MULTISPECIES: Daple [unclassified Actinoplanes]
MDPPPSTEIPPSGAAEPTPWPAERSRLADILGHRPRPVDTASTGPAPSSAPPYPYEGDLDDSYHSATAQRAAVPMPRPVPSARGDWQPAEPGPTLGDPLSRTDAPSEPIRSRHALVNDTLAQGLPRVEPAAPQGDQRSVDNEARTGLPTYDASSFSRRAYEPSAPPAFPAPVFPGYSGTPEEVAAALGEPSDALPQRVPAQPDVPRVPEPPSVEPSAEAPALARIATHLRRGDVVPAQERQEGFDVQAILAAVREVDGVRDASLKATPAGAHSLRLDLADGADAAEVSRHVARLLAERMGLDAAMPGGMPAGPLPADPLSPGPLQSSPTPPPTPAPRPARASVKPVSPAPVPTPAPVSAAPVSTPPAPATERAAVTPRDLNGPRPLDPGDRPGPRVLIENVHVNTFGADASVEVRLRAGDRTASGVATGPAVDGYLLRLCATATAGAVDELLAVSTHTDGPARCFVEHAAAVSFGSTQVAVVVLLLSCAGGGWVEQLSGSAVVTGDDRHAMVRATLAAVNRRAEALLA